MQSSTLLRQRANAENVSLQIGELPLVTSLAVSFAGLKITAGHRTMSGQDDNLSGQNLACHFDQSRTRFPNNQLEKNYLLISGKYKQLNHKISQQLVVTK